MQDETGGINCFPVAGDFKIGDRVRVSGTTSSYQGEHQLAVTDIVKLGEGEAVTPREVTSTQVNDGSCLLYTSPLPSPDRAMTRSSWPAMPPPRTGSVLTKMKPLPSLPAATPATSPSISWAAGWSR